MSYRKGLSAKTVSVLAAVVLLVGLTIGGTVAWIIDGSTQVINTFIYGDINISLEETDTGLDSDGDRNTNDYKMIPDTVISKNPVVTVYAGSEPCWLFVKLEKSGGTAEYDFDDYLSYTVDVANSDDPVNPIMWTEYTGHGLGAATKVYYIELPYETAADTGYHVLAGDTVTVLDTVTKSMIQALGDGASATYPKLTITAYAVQHEEIAGPAEAWALAAVQAPNSNPNPGTPGTPGTP